MSDDARFDPRFDPAFQPGYTGPLATSKPAPRSPVSDPPQPLIARAEQSAELAEVDEPEPRRLNPFLIALSVVAVLLLGGGLFVVSRLRDLFADTQSSSTFDWVTAQTLMYGAPLVIVLGLATGIGVLFVFATRWGRR